MSDIEWKACPPDPILSDRQIDIFHFPLQIYTPQRSTTLRDFVAMTGTPTVNAIDALWERVTVAGSAQPATARPAFTRVRLSLPSGEILLFQADGGGPAVGVEALNAGEFLDD